MNKAKLRWTLTLMVSIASISAFSAEVVNYCTSLKDDDTKRINECKVTINSAMANLTSEELKKANGILIDGMMDLLKDRAALSGSSGNTAQTNNKKSIEKEKYSTLTAEKLSQLGYSPTDCNGLGAYYYSKGNKDGLIDDSTEKQLAYTINTALLEAQQSKVRLHNYLTGFNEAKPALSSESEDAGE